MSKLIAAGLATTGGTAAVVGGSYLLQNGNGTGTSTEQTADNRENQSQSVSQESRNPSTSVANTAQTQDGTSSQTAPILSFSDLNSFKDASASSIECVKDFNGLTSLKGDDSSIKTIDSNTNKIDGAFIGSSDAAATASKGCLIVNWDKKEYSESKGNGNFKLLGTFEKGDKGFISFVVAKETENKKLDLTGIFYALEKSESSGSVVKKKEVSTAKKIDKTNAETNFPKVGDGLKTDLSNSDWWKMFSTKDDLENVCVSSESGCSGSSTDKNLRGYGIGTGSSSSQNSLNGWSNNLSDGWNNLYVNADIAIPTIASSEKGNWEKKSDIVESPKP